MKVLIIGATGMLAKPVIKHLEEQKFKLRLFSRSVKAEEYPTHETVQGDLFNEIDLKKALNGCDAVHITISKVNEAEAVEKIMSVVKNSPVKLVSYVSGSSVCENNRWFWMIDSKYRAEQAIIKSGVPYLIFRPTWFYESLSMMVRNGKASLIGKSDNEFRWIAADDYGKMVAQAYSKDLRNEVLYVYGPEKHSMKKLLPEYCKQEHPEIKKVGQAPIGLLKFIGKLTGNKELKTAAEMFGYFEKIKDNADDSKTKQLLGTNTTGFSEWLGCIQNN